MSTETGEGTTEAEEEAEYMELDDAEDDPETDVDEEVEDELEEETDSPYSPYARSIIVTIGSTLSGMAVAVVSAVYLEDPTGTLPLLLVVAAVLLQRFAYDLMGMDVDDFGAKGNLYIGVMTFALWFITLGLILTTGAIDAL